MIKGLGTGVWAKPFEAVTLGNFAHGESVSLQCRYRVAVARPCAEIFAVCTGVEGLKSRYVLEIPTSLALLCLVVIVEKKHTRTPV